MVHQNCMNGLVKKGHEVYVVTPSDNLKWYVDAYKDYIGESGKVSKPPLTRRLAGVISRNVRSLFKKRPDTSEQGTNDIIAVITNELINNFKKLQVDSDILIATHEYTADAVYKVGRNKRIVMYSLHFEELMFYTEFDRAEVSKIFHLPFSHIVNSTWLYKMFQYNYGIDAELITPGIKFCIFKNTLNKEKYLNIQKIKIITYCDPTREFKGFSQQVNILAKLCALRKDIEVLVYGNDPKEKSFPYRFLGWLTLPELAQYYSEAHILFSSSWYESFPLPAIEAMACGCVAIASRYGTEDYLIDRHSGMVINPFDIDQTIEKIVDLINNPELMYQLAVNGVEISREFNLEIQIDKLNNFLLNLLEPKSVNIPEIQAGNLVELDKIYG